MAGSIRHADMPPDPDHAGALRTLNAFAVDIIAIPNVEDLLWYVARNVVGRLAFVDCVIYLSNDAKTELRQVAALGEKNPYGRMIDTPMDIPFGEGITGKVAQTGKAIVIDDLLRDQTYISDTKPARSEIAVPLVSQGRVVGVIDSEHPAVAAFGQSDLEVLTTVAAMTSAKLDLLAEVERSDRRYRDLVQSHAQLTHEIDARKVLEAELANARRLEAIGRLTGGFAHSFNNLLTVISGNLELVQAAAFEADIIDCLRDAGNAADQGARLIQSMLAFSQQMQLTPEPVDLNALTVETFSRDHPGLSNEIDMDLQEDIWPVAIDPVAAGVAIVNLVLNARDAMPDGGPVRIQTRNLDYDRFQTRDTAMDIRNGRYVRLSVTDRGCGMSEEMRHRIYDPFFTTKPIGKGTGLGLSMVMGFMRQSGGGVLARPARPEGTTFELYFPVAAPIVND